MKNSFKNKAKDISDSITRYFEKDDVLSNTLAARLGGYTATLLILGIPVVRELILSIVTIAIMVEVFLLAWWILVTDKPFKKADSVINIDAQD